MQRIVRLRYSKFALRENLRIPIAADWRGKELLTNYNAFWFPQVVIEDFS